MLHYSPLLPGLGNNDLERDQERSPRMFVFQTFLCLKLSAAAVAQCSCRHVGLLISRSIGLWLWPKKGVVYPHCDSCLGKRPQEEPNFSEKVDFGPSEFVSR